MYVRPKKNLGQHFLVDKNIALKIVESLKAEETKKVIEIGPGTGVLTNYLLERKDLDLTLIEIDRESIPYLHNEFPDLKERIVEADFLKMDLKTLFAEPQAIIGNFPYNISSQIFFKVLEHKNQVPEVVCMIQKEVAERIAVGPGTKAYGILSVLLQAYYDIEYLFTVSETVFNPPPRVKSAVIRLTRNNVQKLDCDEVLFKTVVKTAFNQRRKMLSNSLKGFNIENSSEIEMLKLRAERLSVADFVYLTNLIKQSSN